MNWIEFVRSYSFSKTLEYKVVNEELKTVNTENGKTFECLLIDFSENWVLQLEKGIFPDSDLVSWLTPNKLSINPSR